MNANYCQQCGQKLDAGSSGAGLCPACGTPVGPAAAPQTHRPAGAKKAWKTVLIVVLVVFGAIGLVSVVGIIGLKLMGRQTHQQLMHMQAFDTLRQVHSGLAEYFMKTGVYPELDSWEAMVDPGSPLVTRHMIRAGLPVNDPWGAPYEGRSTKSAFELKCAGRPDMGDDVGPITITQDRVVGAPGSSATAAAHP
jgi:hypothetical protein